MYHVVLRFIGATTNLFSQDLASMIFFPCIILKRSQNVPTVTAESATLNAGQW
jgi:hypothetical protein